MAEVPQISNGDTVDRFYDALAREDLAAARACCVPESVFWHNFDGVEQTLEQASQGWQGLFAAFTGNRVDEVRREAIADGVVQRHRFLLRGEDGLWKAKPCCIFVSFENGLISRLEEYIDLSGSLPVDETTAGGTQ